MVNLCAGQHRKVMDSSGNWPVAGAVVGADGDVAAAAGIVVAVGTDVADGDAAGFVAVAVIALISAAAAAVAGSGSGLEILVMRYLTCCGSASCFAASSFAL